METCTPTPPRAVQDADFRPVMSLFATGIVVVTVDTEEGLVHGVTVNSFTSVSVAPPTVLVSLKPGAANRLLALNGRFGASILDEAQQGLSTHFGGRPTQGILPDFVVRERAPTLRRCLAWFECEVFDAIDVHDHTLFLAHVTACGRQEGAPLLFFGSRYHRAPGATL